jgi:putative membrane protein
MRRILLKWLINALALYIATFWVKGIEVAGTGALLLGAALLGILNALIRPLLIILTLPVTILTLGLFALVVNGFMLWLVSFLVQGFFIQGFWAAFWGALFVSIVSGIINWLIE